MKIIVAVTGASGTIYARQCLEKLLQCNDVEQIALIVSRCGEEVARHEGIDLPCDQRIVRYSADDMFAPTASGSARYEKMIIIPASMGTIGRIASGVSLSLIERSADVMLKERAFCQIQSFLKRCSKIYVLHRGHSLAVNMDMAKDGVCGRNVLCPSYCLVNHIVITASFTLAKNVGFDKLHFLA
jgi:flavoprotein